MEEKTETSSTNLREFPFLSISTTVMTISHFWMPDVLIHPLVVMSIADHQTREKVHHSFKPESNFVPKITALDVLHLCSLLRSKTAETG